MRTTSTTPGSVLRFSVSNCSTSPTRPTIVRCTPRETNAEPPASSTVRTTASSSSAVTPGAITTTMRPLFHPANCLLMRVYAHQQAIGLDLEALYGGVGALAWTELDEVHRREHQQRTDNRARSENVTTDSHAEDAGEDRLHRHHDRGARRQQV